MARVGQQVRTVAEAAALPVGSVLVELMGDRDDKEGLYDGPRSVTWLRLVSGWLQPVTVVNGGLSGGLDDAAMVVDVGTYPLVVAYVGAGPVVAHLGSDLPAKRARRRNRAR